jgi:hypothetical protein
MFYLSMLVACLPPLRIGFEHRCLEMRFMVHKVVLELVSLLELQFSLIIIIAPMVHTRFHLDSALDL